jgi:outer membrane autotransporter protein
MKTSTKTLRIFRGPLTVLTLALGLHAMAQQLEYTWTFDGSPSGTAGGSGTWSGAGLNWWNGSAVIAAGNSGAANQFGGASGTARLIFAGSGTITKQGTAVFYNSASVQHTMAFLDGSHYTLLGAADGSAVIGNSHFIFNVAPTASLTIGGDGNVFLVRATTNVTGAPGLAFQGGGSVTLGAGALLRNDNANSRMSVDGGTVLDFQAGSMYAGVGETFATGSYTDLGRIYINEGAITVNGGVFHTGYSGLVAANTSRSLGIGIGVTATGTGGSLTINSGTVVALGDPRNIGDLYAGIVIGGAANNTGGVLTLNDGALITTGIRANASAQTVTFNINGGVIVVSTELAAANADITDEHLQSRLDRFIIGFANDTITIGAGGATFDTSRIDTVRTNGIATITPQMGGDGGLTKTGANTLALARKNIYTGATRVEEGSLKLGDVDAIASSTAIFVAGGATLDFSGTFDVFYSQKLTNLSGGGTIMTGTATLTAHAADDTTFSGDITGSGTLIKTGMAALALTGTNSFAAINVADGALAGNSASLPADIALAAVTSTVVFNQTADGAYDGEISGAGAFEKTGAGTLVMDTAATNTGPAAIRGGTLAAGAADLLATNAALEIADGATFDAAGHDQTFAHLTGAGAIRLGGANLALDGAEDTAFSGAIAGTGTLTKTGAATLTLSGTNTLGGIIIATDTLRAGAGALSGRVANDASLVLEQQGNAPLAARFSGTGSWWKTGAGIVTLTDDSAAYAGAISIDAGGLMLGGGAAALGGDITIAGGARFGGAGTAEGNVTARPGAMLIVGADGGASPETLVIGGTLDIENTVLRFDLFAGDRSDVLEADMGTLRLAGSNTIDIGLFVSGTFTLADNLGPLESLRLTVNGFEPGAGARQTGTLVNTGGALQLIAGADSSRTLTWTGASGTSAWNPNVANWDGVGSGLFASSDKVIFDGGPDPDGVRVINIEGDGVLVSDMVVTGDADYTFTGAGITAKVIVIGDVLTGATGKLVKDGAGTLTFDNAAGNFEGGVDLLGGTLVLGAAASPGTGTLSFLGAGVTLRAGADGVDIAGPVNAAAAGVIDTQTHTLSLAGPVSGSAMLMKTGAGALVLHSANTHAGFNLAGGALVLMHHSALGQTLAVTGSATSVHAGAGALEIGTRIELGEHPLLFDTHDHDTTLTGPISGAGLLVKTGAGALTLASANTHGGTVLDQGVLEITNAAALGGRLAATGTDATLRIAAAGLDVSSALGTGTVGLKIDIGAHDTTFTSEISGQGAFVKTGAATLALAGINAVASLEVAEGRLRAMRTEALGTGPVRLADDTVLELSGATGNLYNDITRAATAARGGSVEFTHRSNVGIAAPILARDITIKDNSRVAARHAGALGGAALLPVRVEAGSSLIAGAPGLIAGDITINDGALLFETGAYLTARTVSLTDGATIGLAAAVPSGEYLFLSTTGGITGPVNFTPVQFGMGVNVEKHANLLLFSVYNLAVNPAKDAAMTFDAVRAATSTIYSRMNESFVTPLSAPLEGGTDRGMWARLFGSGAEYAQRGSHIGFTDRTYGAALGVDRVFHDRLLLGAWAAASASRLETDNGSATDADMQMAGLYTAVKAGRVHFSADIMHGILQSDTSRNEAVGMSYGYYKGDFIGAGAELGFLLIDWKTGALRPAATLHYLGMNFKDQHETGPGAIAVDDFSQNLLQTHLRLQVAQNFAMPVVGWPSLLDLAFGWRQNLSGNECSVTMCYADSSGTPFVLETSGYVRGCTTIGFGVRSAVSESVAVGFAYDYEISAGRQRHTVNGSLRWAW